MANNAGCAIFNSRCSTIGRIVDTGRAKVFPVRLKACMAKHIESFSPAATRAILPYGSATFGGISSLDTPELHLDIARSFVYWVVSE